MESDWTSNISFFVGSRTIAKSSFLDSTSASRVVLSATKTRNCSMGNLEESLGMTSVK